jgi:hypothetical protein
MAKGKRDETTKTGAPSAAGSRDLGRCEVQGCKCPKFIGGAGSFDWCRRKGCGHRDYDHEIK